MEAVNTFAKKKKSENIKRGTKIYLGDDGVGIKEYVISPFSPASLSVALNEREKKGRIFLVIHMYLSLHHYAPTSTSNYRCVNEP